MTSDPNVKGVLITGTTSGIGQALLELYVRQGVPVIAVNRRPVPELESRYPSVRFECVDVRSREGVASLMGGLAASEQLPELFILNAGINHVDNDDALRLSAYRDVIETNLFGVLNFVAPLTQFTASSIRRHVVAINSMASYAGNPYGLGYHTSKRALKACFEIWSRMYAGTDLVFQQVMLGPVRTGMFTMADKFPAWIVRVRDLFSASPDATARAIARFAVTTHRTLIYPLPALFAFRALSLGQRLVPGFMQGRRTLDGKARRAQARP
jgi:NAD(P)-dependent dehydrogenase (short-subunit alcohol dehydrogenase family)